MRRSRIAGSPATMNWGITVTKKAPVFGFRRLLKRPWPQALRSPSVARGTSGSAGALDSKLRRPRYARYAAPASLRIVKAVDERSRSTPTPNVAAAAHARMPTATPKADIVDARGPDAIALRM